LRLSPDLERVLVNVLEVRHVPDGDLAEASGFVEQETLEDVPARNILEVAEPVQAKVMV
jgi:hypothetical protein